MGEYLSMVVLLPREVDGLEALEESLTVESLNDRLAEPNFSMGSGKREVVVYLPKFKETCEFSLAGILAAMGMANAFSYGKADFWGMDGTKELFISAVAHKAVVEVNEEGTEAAASTGVVMGITSLPPLPPVFRADHPFVFLIRDNASGSILFIGRIMDPSAES